MRTWWAILGSVPVLLTGCESLEEAGDTEAAHAGTVLAPPPELVLSGTGSMLNLGDGTVRDFDVMWGPYSDSSPAFSGSYAPPNYQVTCNAGYVYVSGKLASTAPSGALAPAAPLILPWPTVVASQVRAAADGTFIIAEVQATQVRIFRLYSSSGSGATVKTWLNGSTGTTDMSSTTISEVVVATRTGTVWTLASPRALDTAETTWVNGVVETARAAGLRAPAP